MRPTTAPVIVAALVLALVGACSPTPDAPATPTSPSSSSPAPTGRPSTTAPGTDGVPVKTEPPGDADEGQGDGDPADGADSSGDAVPQVTYAGPGETGTWEVAGVVPGVIENGGTCRFTLTASGRPPVEATTTGIADASSTSCGTAVLPADSLASGTWRVELAYAGEVSGVSAPATLEVP